MTWIRSPWCLTIVGAIVERPLQDLCQHVLGTAGLETAHRFHVPGLTTCVTATDTLDMDVADDEAHRARPVDSQKDGALSAGRSRTPSGIVVPWPLRGADELGRSGLRGRSIIISGSALERLLISASMEPCRRARSLAAPGGATFIYSPAGAQDVLTEILKGRSNIAPTSSSTRATESGHGGARFGFSRRLRAACQCSRSLSQAALPCRRR